MVVEDLGRALAVLTVLGIDDLARLDGDAFGGQVGPLWLEVARPAAGSADAAWMGAHGPGIRCLLLTGSGASRPGDEIETVVGCAIEPIGTRPWAAAAPT
jgi:hypothetical protein